MSGRVDHFSLPRRKGRATEGVRCLPAKPVGDFLSYVIPHSTPPHSHSSRAAAAACAEHSLSFFVQGLRFVDPEVGAKASLQNAIGGTPLARWAAAESTEGETLSLELRRGGGSLYIYISPQAFEKSLCCTDSQSDERGRELGQHQAQVARITPQQNSL